MTHTSVKQTIYDHFLSRIRDGEIATGGRLPTEAEVARDFAVSRSTVQAVMARLSQEGIVRRHPGRGTFACRADDDMRVRVNLDIHNIQSFESEVAVAGDRVSYKLLSFSRVLAPPRAAQKLGIEPGTEIFALHRIRFIGADCIGSELRYFSPDIPLDLSTRALETEGAHTIIEDGLGLRIGRIDAALRAVSATPQEAAHLGIEAGAPLLVRSHTLFSEDGQVILHGESFYVEPFSFRYSASVRA